MKKILFIACAALLLAACGGSSSSKEAEEQQKEKTIADKMIELIEDGTKDIEKATTKEEFEAARTAFLRSQEEFSTEHRQEIEIFTDTISKEEKKAVEERVSAAQKEYYRVVEEKKNEFN